jgi:hypothetical protein
MIRDRLAASISIAALLTAVVLSSACDAGGGVRDPDPTGIDPPDFSYPDGYTPPPSSGSIGKIPVDGADMGPDATLPIGPPGPEVAIGATSDVAQLPVLATVDGSGVADDNTPDPFTDAIAINNNFGEVTLGGRAVDALAYDIIGEVGESPLIVQAVAVDQQEIFWLQFFCEGGSLTNVLYERVGGSRFDVESATGSCVVSGGGNSATVNFVAADIGEVRRLTGYSIVGDDISLRGEADDEIVLGGTAYEAAVYQYFDCVNADCGGDQYVELHVALWDEDTEELILGLVFLDPTLDRPDAAALQKMIALPTLRFPVDTLFTGVDWTVNGFEGSDGS